MMVFNVKGQMVEVGPGVVGVEAEAAVSNDCEKDVFVYAWSFDGCRGYSVSEKSNYGTMCDDGFDEDNCIENYEELKGAEKSKYYAVFSALDNVLKLIEG